MRGIRILLLLALALTACRGPSPSAQTVSQQQLEHEVDSLMPLVARAAGLPFKTTPRSAVRTRDDIRQYLLAKMHQDFSADRMEGLNGVYHLLRLIPDSVDLEQLIVNLYTEQVAGFYDPDSTALFAVQGGDPTELRVVLAHELVHALQDQYVPLQAVLHDTTDSDRQTAAQAVMEGQATLISLVVLAPELKLRTNDTFWSTFRSMMRSQEKGTGVFASAPLAVQEDVTFPYVYGADFVRWFKNTHPDSEPFGAAMPQSTEQILHVDRYAAHDTPIRVRFASDSMRPLLEDTFGEFDIDLIRAVANGDTVVRTEPAIGWGGDRFRLSRTANGLRLVWITVWDRPADADRFDREVVQPLARHPLPGYRVTSRPGTYHGRASVTVEVARK